MLASVDVDTPAVFLDTGPAAALGALQDPAVGERRRAVLVLNLGNMHALASTSAAHRIVSLYEHHTGEMTDRADRRLHPAPHRRSTLPHEEVFNSKGHGVYYAAAASAAAQPGSSPSPALSAAGIRRTALNPYFAAPHGDMMLSGCFGCSRAFAHRYPQHAAEIQHALDA